MNNPILNSWISFIEDIGVPPPSPPHQLSKSGNHGAQTELEDPTRLKQKRPLLSKSTL